MLSPAAKARLSAPLILAIIVVAGGLYAIVWTVQWSQAGRSTSIQAATQAGAAMVQPAQPPISYASNVGVALPEFQMSIALLPSDPWPFNNHTWLATADVGEGLWVYAVPDDGSDGAWLACRWIDTVTMTYATEAERAIGMIDGWDQQVWAGLGIQQDAVIEVCNG